jgi:phosphoribosylanthranilate isomerase
MRVKICCVTKPDQGSSIVALGAKILGFICVSGSARYVQPSQIKAIIDCIPNHIHTIGVFADAKPAEIARVISETGLTGVQLHGTESPEYCQQLRELLSNQIELIKAFRVQTVASLAQVDLYSNYVDTLLLDAYHPQLLGGTGATLDWEALAEFKPKLPWFLAGGLTPDNILDALDKVKPDGIDLCSGVERSPGDKDLAKVARLFDELGHFW